jgi:hypothetical protein
VNKGKKEGRVRLDWSDAAGSGLCLLDYMKQGPYEHPDEVWMPSALN